MPRLILPVCSAGNTGGAGESEAAGNPAGIGLLQRSFHCGKILTDNGIRLFRGGGQRRELPAQQADPEIYLHTASCLGVEPQRCLVAEDSTAGITAAHLAGMRVAAVVDDRFGFDRSLADYEVKQISDILQLVEGKTDEKTGGQDK